ncbi:MAG: hypothetical protein LH629_10035, partial [Ignavibacteria bacterium]|nr:hypothetical protein [Ignavibacteria bacterium]
HNCISLQVIRKKRQKESDRLPDLQRCTEIIRVLSQLNQVNFDINQQGNNLNQIKIHIDRAYKEIHKSSNSMDLLLSINPNSNHPSVVELKDIFGSTLTRLIEIILDRAGSGGIKNKSQSDVMTKEAIK